MICDRCGRLKNRATGECLVCADHAGAAPPPVATREVAAGPEAVVEPVAVGASASGGSSASAAPGPEGLPPSVHVRPASAGEGPLGGAYDPMLHRPPRTEPVAEPQPPAPAPAAADPEARPSSPYRLAPRAETPPARPASKPFDQEDDDLPVRSVAATLRNATPSPAPAPTGPPPVRDRAPAPMAPAAGPAPTATASVASPAVPAPEASGPMPPAAGRASAASGPMASAPVAPSPVRETVPSPAPTPSAAGSTAPARAAAPSQVRASASASMPSTPPPPPVPEPDRPISLSAAAAFLDLNGDNAERKARQAAAAAATTTTTLPAVVRSTALVEPTVKEQRHPDAPVGVVRHAKLKRRAVDVVIYDGGIVIARKGAPTNLTVSQLSAQEPSSRRIQGDAVDDVVVREDVLSGQARLHLRNGEELVLRWPGWKNRGLEVENLLTHAFSGKVDQGSPEIVQRTVRVMVTLGVVILVAVGAFLGASALFKGDPPPPPPPAPSTTLPPTEQMIRAELRPVCPAWLDFAANVGTGDRPDPTAMRPLVDGLRPHFDAAASVAGADPGYAPARDEVAYLQDLARKPVDAVGRESVSRVHYSMDEVTSACQRAMS